MKHPQLTCIIDDDPIFVFGTKRLMQKSNLCTEFLVYQNGFEALQGLQERLEAHEPMPDLMFLDLNMPIMDGWEFLDAYHKMQPPLSIPIFLVTSSIDPADLKRAEHFDLQQNYITKPMTIQTLHTIFGL